MTPELRERMGDAAVAGAKAIDYVGAGTIEMLLDEDGSFYFMEMNTRIQVEHPVTEMLTGVDLVKEQIRVAAGRAAQRERAAAAARPRDRVPRQRRGSDAQFPAVAGEDPRVPSAGRHRACASTRTSTTGYTVPPFYDSLIAKLICQGKDREEAIARMHVALETFIIEGVDDDDSVSRARDAEPAVPGRRRGHEVPGARDRALSRSPA